MNTADAIYEYIKSEIVPMVAGDSEFAASLLNGALRTSRKAIAGKLADSTMLQTLGLIDESGKIDEENFKEFADGMFENNDVVKLPMQKLCQALLGKNFNLESLETVIELAGGDGDCLKGNLKLARADADHFLELLRQ